MERTKCFIAWIFFCLCLSPAYGQSDEPVPIEVKQFQIALETAMTVKSMNGDMMKGGGISSTVGLDSDEQVVVVIKCLNPSPKEVKVIHWNLRYSAQDTQTNTFSSTSDKKIKPGKETEIKLALPLTAKQLSQALKVGYRIARIEFNDKSIWENSDKAEIKLVKFEIKP